MKTHINDDYNADPTAFNDAVGGKQKKWKSKLEIGKNINQVKPQTKVGEDLVINKTELINPYGQNPFTVKIDSCTGFDDLCHKIKQYASSNTDLRASTIARRLSYLHLMADRQQPFPIDFFNPNYTQYIYHMTWYKENKYNPETGKNFYGLKQRKETFETYLDAVGISRGFFHYTLPEYPQEKPICYPNPNIAFDITRYPFFKDKDENRLYQMIHLYNFVVGPRPEAEDCILKIDNINWDDCIITYPQPKRKYKIREIFIEESFINGRTRKSLRNYVDHLRPKFISQYSGDYLFISPKTGKPFTTDYLRKQLTKTGKMVYPVFYPYMARHFCATGRLIKCYLERDPDPIKTVQDFMDHYSRKNTERYTQKAKQFYAKYNFNWFQRLLKNKNITCWVKIAKNQNTQKIPLFRMETLRESGTALSGFEPLSLAPKAKMLTTTLQGHRL